MVSKLTAATGLAYASINIICFSLLLLVLFTVEFRVIVFNLIHKLNIFIFTLV